MIVLTNTGGVAMTNCYLIADEIAKKAVLFDAPDHTVAPLLDEAVKRGWDVQGLWLTHGHFDHFSDHTVVRQRFPNSKNLIHADEELKTKNTTIQEHLFGLPFPLVPLPIDSYLTDGQQLSIGSIQVQVIHTPGHAPGHVVFYLQKEKVLVGGDLIIGGSIGRTDLPDSNQADMVKSLIKVMKLPGDTQLLGGHGPASTLDEERETNYYLRDLLEAQG